MAHEDRGHYAKKHPEESKLNPVLSEAVKKSAPGDSITCSATFKIAEELGSTPDELGLTLDILEKRIIKCQLGLFGYEPEKKAVKGMEKVPQGLQEAISTEAADNRISCRTAWNIAKVMEIEKMDVSCACETMGIKISPCQLGAFKKAPSS